MTIHVGEDCINTDKILFPWRILSLVNLNLNTIGHLLLFKLLAPGAKILIEQLMVFIQRNTFLSLVSGGISFVLLKILLFVGVNHTFFGCEHGCLEFVEIEEAEEDFECIVVGLLVCFD